MDPSFTTSPRAQRVLERGGSLDCRAQLLSDGAAHPSPNDVASHNATNSSCWFLEGRDPSQPQPIHHFLRDLCCRLRLRHPEETVQYAGASNTGRVFRRHADGPGAAPLLKDRRFWENFLSSNSNALAGWNVNKSAGNGSLGWGGRRWGLESSEFGSNRVPDPPLPMPASLLRAHPTGPDSAHELLSLTFDC